MMCRKNLTLFSVFVSLLFIFTASCKQQKVTNRRTGFQQAAKQKTEDVEKKAVETPERDIAPPIEDISVLNGCLKKQNINQMEIILKGATEEPLQVEKSAKNIKQNTGVPDQLTFYFNDGFAHTEQNAMATLQQNSGRIVITDLSPYTVDQIKYFRISQDGHKYQSTAFQDYDFFQGFVTRYKVEETSRFRINEITVKINGREYYRLGGRQDVISSKDKIWGDNETGVSLEENLITKAILAEKCEGDETAPPASNSEAAEAPDSSKLTE